MLLGWFASLPIGYEQVFGVLPAHWPLILDVGTVLEFTPLLIGASFVYFSLPKEVGSVWQYNLIKEVIYSHYNGPHWSVTSQMKAIMRNIKHVIIQSIETRDSFGNTRAHANNEYAEFLNGWLYFKNIGYTSILVTFHVVSAETSHIIRDGAQTEQFLQKWIWGIYCCRWVATGNGGVPTLYIHVCCGESLVKILFSFNLICLGNHQTKSQFKFNPMFKSQRQIVGIVPMFCCFLWFLNPQGLHSKRKGTRVVTFSTLRGCF